MMLLRSIAYVIIYTNMTCYSTSYFWYHTASGNPNLIMFLVANKVDLEDKRKVGYEVFHNLTFLPSFVFFFPFLVVVEVSVMKIISYPQTHQPELLKSFAVTLSNSWLQISYFMLFIAGIILRKTNQKYMFTCNSGDSY